MTGGALKAPAGDTRGKLLRAAGEVFADAGYQAATIRRIAARAGVNVALVNYHFRSKLGLYTEVLRESICAAKIGSVRDALERNAPPEENLRQAIRARLLALGSADQRAWHFRITTHEFLRPTPAMARVVNEAIRPLYNRMRELIGEIMGLPPDDETTRLCVNSIIGQILAYAHPSPVMARLWPELKMTSEQLGHIADHITDFSLAYLHQARKKPRRKRK